MKIVPWCMVHAFKLQGKHEMEIVVASMEDIIWGSTLEVTPMMIFFLMNKSCMLETIIN